MSKAKDRDRAKQFVYRNGVKHSRSAWDKYQRELREAIEEQRLKVMGLVKGKPKIVTAERAGLEKAEKRIMTPEEVLKERQSAIESPKFGVG